MSTTYFEPFEEQHIYQSEDFQENVRFLTIQCNSYPEVHEFSAILVLLSVLQCSIFLALFFVAVFVYDPMMRQCESEVEEPYVPPPIPFEEKYPIEDANDDDIRVDKNSFVLVDTPNGNVIMRYSYDEEGFLYWADKSISYRHLETVARKFVTQFSCSSLYTMRNIDIKKLEEEPDQQEEDTVKDDIQESNEDKDENKEENTKEVNDEKAEGSNADEDKKSSVFASFKTYNKRAETITGGKEKGARNDPSKGCKFIRVGKMSEFSIIQPKVIDEPKKKIDFETFKKMFFSQDTSESSNVSNHEHQE